jgi:hypothetical protein
LKPRLTTGQGASFPALSSPPKDGPIGAYGLRLEGISDARSLLVPADRNWPTFHIDRETGEPPWREFDVVTDSDAQLMLQTGGEIRIVREPGTVIFSTEHGVSEEALVHPYLAPVAAVVAYWFDRESFHAGAFVVDGGAWAVLGERESGKSTLLASLALHGIDVLSDDMLILDRDSPFAGPRSVDLRATAAQHLGIGQHLGVVGARERWRLQLGPTSAGASLRGWIFLAWGSRVETVRVEPHERIVRLGAQRGVRLPPKDPARLLDLAGLPAWELRRPHDWNALDAATDALIDLVRSQVA